MLLHHAGLLLMTPMIEELTKDWRVRPDLPRQWIAQVLLGAVNHEQSKQLNFDPHTSDYTGECKILKGWCGGKSRVEKVLNMNFIHTHKGTPCFVQHTDVYYDMRIHFLACASAFHQIRACPEEPLIWVIDRGIYGLQALQRIRDVLGDHIINWEKGYERDGWKNDGQTQQFDMVRARNHSEDVRTYRFEWQPVSRQRDQRFQRIIVRATNPRGNTIEVAIFCSDAQQDPESIIAAIFNRWLQENDFGYMDRHVGINELTSRARRPYADVADTLADQLVESRVCKALKNRKTKAMPH